MSQEDVIDILAIDLLGIVPDDEAIITSTNRGEPAVYDKSSRAGLAYNNIARRILGEQVPLMDLEERPGLMVRLGNLFGGGSSNRSRSRRV